MPRTELIDIKELSLDLKNPRTIPQPSEGKAIETMISISPERFSAVMESILDDGYLTTENIIVLEDDGKYTVKEGNRRIAILKIIHGILDKNAYAIPPELKTRIDKLTPEWLAENRKISCCVYSPEEAHIANKIVNLTHAKAEKAGRDPWTAIAKARHNRDNKGSNEFGLDLLEKYLQHGKNINQYQREKWSGDYPITVLDDALKKISDRMNFAAPKDLIAAYPRIDHRAALEEILLAIGNKQIGFKEIRDKQNDFLQSYGLAPQEAAPAAADTSNEQPHTSGNGPAPSQADNHTPNGGGTPTEAPQIPEQPTPAAPTTQSKPQSTQLGTPRYVKDKLTKFTPRGERSKVTAIKKEMQILNLEKTPMAFCLLLRSAFEISAKEYCKDKGIPTETNSKNDPQSKTLSQLLTAVVNHLTNNHANKDMEKVLHGALTEINKPEGILSITSMNQLVHNPIFTIATSDICTIFGNIFPLLEAMN